MDPLTMMALGSIAQIGGGVMGNILSSGDRNAAMGDINAMINAINSLELPELDKEMVFQQFLAGEDFTPEMLMKVAEEYSAPEMLQEDPSMRLEQLAALADIKQLANQGLGPQDALAMETARRAAAAESMANRQSIKQDRATRGMSGAGEELAAMLQASQAADDRLAMQNMQAASEAATRRSGALRDMMSASSGIRDQDYRTNARNADARELNRQFQIKNSLARQAANVQAQNQAQQYNMLRADNARNANTEMYNRDLEYRVRQVPQLNFQNQMAKLGAQNQALGARAGVNMQNAANTAQMWGQIGGGVGMGLSGIGQYQNNQQMAAQQQKNMDRYFDIMEGKRRQNSDSLQPPQYGLGTNFNWNW